MIGFLIYKVYNKVFYGRDSTPWYRVYLYISLLLMTLTFSLYLLLSGLFENLIKYNIISLSIDFSNSYIFFILLFGILPFVYTYFRFFYKKDIEYYNEKYSNHWLNKFYFRGIFFFLYFFLFLLGPISRVLLFGGYMLGKDYEGYLIFLFK
jgi:hypothetical protein